MIKTLYVLKKCDPVSGCNWYKQAACLVAGSFPCHPVHHVWQLKARKIPRMTNKAFLSGILTSPCAASEMNRTFY